MNKRTIDRKQIPFFSKTVNDLVYHQEKFSDFINIPFSTENFKNQILSKKENFNNDFREVLVEELLADYKGIATDKIEKQIKSLESEDTFTITTGHQLNLFTGPLFFIYKIFHVIKMTEVLNKKYPDNHFVPVYWMASEDHDFEEINHLHLFGDKFSWDSEQKGAVGRFKLEGFDSIKKELLGKFENDKEIQKLIEKHYNESDSLSQATFKFVNELFHSYGLLILDADKKALKNLFKPIIKEEITKQFSGYRVEKTSRKLIDQGVKTLVNPRGVNLFYLQDGSREGIIKNEDSSFTIGDKTFEHEELLKDLDENPERFSPNVVLRPVYQEFILPNLCYVGGGGEISYWLQLKEVFEGIDLNYPIIQVRNSIQILDEIAVKKLDKLSLQIEDTFNDIDQVKKEYVMKHAENELDFSKLDEVGEELASKMQNLILSVDEGLKGYSQSEIAKFNKQLENVKSKMIRHKKKKHEDIMNQIDNLYSRMYPDNSLQERYENVLHYFSVFGKERFMEIIYDVIDPEERDMIFLVDEK